MFNRMPKLASAGAIAALMAAAAVAQEGVTDWDTDGDQMISQDEFRAGWDEAGVFDAWDADDDDAVSQEEFDAGVAEADDASDWADADIAAWDEDASGDLSGDEFANAVFTEHDADASGDWNEEETAAFGDDAGEGGVWDW